MRDATPYPWMSEARCATTDPDLFTPEQGASVRDPKRFCATCPVVAECLQFGLWEQDGIYGNMTPRERRDYRAANNIPRRIRPHKTECKNGHNLLALGAVQIRASGRRMCAVCDRERKTARQEAAHGVAVV